MKNQIKIEPEEQVESTKQGTNSNILVITLNIKGLNAPIKR